MHGFLKNSLKHLMKLESDLIFLSATGSLFHNIGIWNLSTDFAPTEK